MVKVGSMKRSNRILLIASVFALSVVSADAGLWKRAKADRASKEVPAAGMSLTSIDADASRVQLRTSSTPAYTSYSPAPDLFVVDLTGTSKASGLVLPAVMPAGVSSIAADDVVEMGAHLTRVTFRLLAAATPRASVDGSVVTVSIAPPAMADSASATVSPAVTQEAEPKPAEQTATVAAPMASEPHAETIPEPVKAPDTEPVATSESLPLQSAKRLKSIVTQGAGDAIQVTLAGDGELTYKAFRLNAPERLVLDLTGVRNATARSNVAVSDSIVKRVRVSQFKSSPDPVTRVVLDLGSRSDYRIVRDGERLRVVFGSGNAVADGPATPAVATTQKEARTEVTVTPAAADTRKTDVVSQVPAIAENASSSWKMPEPASAGARQVINAPQDQTPPVTTTTTTTAISRARGVSTRPAADPSGINDAENVFNDPAAPRASANTSGVRPAGSTGTTQGTAISGQLSASGRTLNPGERVYTGEPISLNLKDADIKDVLRTFAQLTGLNVAVDPQVNGTVTVDFVDVPWDQALDIILRQNDLTYDLEGNVMRVGRVERIANEKAANRKLLEEERLNVPLVTYSFPLSYARAADVQTLLREIASPRARIIIDTRTNQLIVSEIPQYLQTMRSLIDSIDVPTRQVVIEARIVETSKSFSQAYGVEWGFQGALDPALGNGTGLVFPNRLNFVGGPFSFSGGAPTILETHLTDVLGTFNLDLRLNAAESEGLVRVIGAPKVTTQDNMLAEIQSGVQIPYQTRVNFTTTVQYIDATLRLSVTPQITQAGTVIMDIQVQKTTPGQPIDGAAGTPLNTRTAHTKLMVRDGGTAVIGGIYQVQEATSQSRIPILHQIPVLGNLFKSHNMTTSHDELLIFITPRIVRNS
jgi:type IV pilus assembly protein PilQ